MAFTEGEVTALQTVASVSSSLSAVGSAYIMYSYYTNRDGGNSFSNKLAAILSVLDFAQSIFFAMGPGGITPIGLCYFQGIGIQLFALAAVLWSTCMSVNLYLWVVKRKTESTLVSYLPHYWIFTMGISILCAIIAASTDSIEDATLWCWISRVDMQMGLFYAWTVAAWFLATGIFLAVKRELHSRASKAGHRVHHVHTYKDVLISKLSEYLVIFIVTRFFGLLNRLVSAVDEPVFALFLLHVMFVPSQGVFNAWTYGGLRVHTDKVLLWMYRRLGLQTSEQKYKQPNRSSHRDMYGSDEEWATKRLSLRGLGSAQAVKLYVATWNMGEAYPPENLADWLIPNLDIYVIGVQECMFVEKFIHATQHALGGEEEYVYYSAEIGSTKKQFGYHGHISIVVYAKKSLVDSGQFQLSDRASDKVKRGANLIYTRAANKGAVGLPFRFGNTTLAFATCHLASDSKGKSKVENRNIDARNIISDLSLNYDDTTYDFHEMFHHCFIFGDMNYRLACSADDAIAQLVTASALEQTDDPAQQIAADEAWAKLMKYDELQDQMAKKSVFTHFEEGNVRFPMTYRRERGVDGECADYTDVDEVTNCYTTTVKEKDGTTTDRTPSFTDRVLYHSLPDVGSELRLLQYSQCEFIRPSDHNPVFAVFDLDIADVDDDTSSDWTRLTPFEITLEEMGLTWHMAVTEETGTNYIVENLVCVLPLPSEDPDVAVRKLDDLMQSMPGAQDVVPTPTREKFSKASNTFAYIWSEHKNDTIVFVTEAVPARGMHMLIQFTNNIDVNLGQGVICLRDCLAAGSTLPVSIELTSGGKLVGEFVCNVSVRCPSRDGKFSKQATVGLSQSAPKPRSRAESSDRGKYNRGRSPTDSQYSYTETDVSSSSGSSR
eukprot:GFYU01006197.1.p1 GENE.GFYU01006197.1~~GFYU01006197.1.p1  ORF type:complete len:888 (-),score=155.44 GFYU01006197.1:53-2716(-)